MSLFVYVSVGLSECVPQVCWCLQRSDKGTRFPGAKVTGSCAPPSPRGKLHLLLTTEYRATSPAEPTHTLFATPSISNQTY